MRSFLAALRSLVLPYGATSGNRIVLDGVNALISAVGSTGTIQITVSGGKPALDFLDSTGTLRVQLVWDDVSDSWFLGGPLSNYYSDLFGIFLENSIASNGVRFDDTTGYLYSGTRSVKSDWTTLAYANGWVTRPGFFPLAYKVTPDGFVHLRGTCTPGTINAVISTLPAGVRPASNVQFPCAHDNVTAGNAARVTISTTGTITAFGMAAAGTTFSLDQIAFPLI